MVHINELYPPSMLKPLLPYKVICDNRLKEKEHLKKWQNLLNLATDTVAK